MQDDVLMEESKGVIARMCNKCSFNTYTQDGSMKTENKCFSRDFPELCWIFPILDFIAFLVKTEHFKTHQN